MARHQVDMGMPQQTVGNADVVFKVKSDQGVVGTLKVSRGGLEWVPKNKTYGHRVPWVKLDVLLRNGSGDSG